MSVKLVRLVLRWRLAALKLMTNVSGGSNPIVCGLQRRVPKMFVQTLSEHVSFYLPVRTRFFYSQRLFFIYTNAYL